MIGNYKNYKKTETVSGDKQTNKKKTCTGFDENEGTGCGHVFPFCLLFRVGCRHFSSGTFKWTEDEVTTVYLW